MRLPPLIRAIFVCVVMFGSSSCIAQEPAKPPLTDSERSELELFRASSSPDYANYLSQYYRQQAERGDILVRVLRWQLVAADVVLGLIVVLALGGLALAAYQLWVAARIALRSQGVGGVILAEEKPVGTAIDQLSTVGISATRIQLQTSFVGIVVLVISGAFLILFVHEIYHINIVDLASVPPASSPIKR